VHVQHIYEHAKNHASDCRPLSRRQDERRDSAADSRALTRPEIIELKGVDLSEYAGDYYSNELQVTLRFVVDNNQ